MSEKNFMSYGDAETVFSEYANAIKALDPEGGTLDTRLSAVENVIPSGASASNQLVVEHTKLTSSDNIDNLTTPGFYGGYNGDNIGGTFPYTGNGQFTLIVTKAREYSYQICRMGYKEWQRYYNNEWAEWVQTIHSSDLTSTVTSGSTAPVTSGGVYDYVSTNTWVQGANVGSNTATFVLPNGLYLVSIDAHGYDTQLALYLVAAYSNNQLNIMRLASTYSTGPTFSRDSTAGTLTVTTSGAAFLTVNYQRVGTYY